MDIYHLTQLESQFLSKNFKTGLTLVILIPKEQ